MSDGARARPEFTGERVVIGRDDEWWRGDSRDSEHAARYVFALQWLPSHARVVDVACGTGYGSGLLAAAGHRVLGFDVDPDAIGWAMTQWPEVDFQIADATRLPMADKSVDAVVSFETIEHLPDPAGFIAEAMRIVKPDGILVLSTPDRPIYRARSGVNPYHISELDRGELRELLAAHFDVKWYGQTLARPSSWQTRVIERWRDLGRRRSRRAAEQQFWPVPLDDRPWVYLVAVCHSRLAATAL